jgi:two-component system chemotaxis response regulator CheB
MNKKIRVIVIDDSKVIQDMLVKILETDSELEIVGTAQDPFEARDLIRRLNPDVITLDIIMPNMDGITFLKNIMRLRPMPVVVVSSITRQKQAVTIEALELGAIDYLTKPTQDELPEFRQHLIEAVKVAAKANISLRTPRRRDLLMTGVQSIEKLLIDNPLLRTTIVAMGASTGGVEALEAILTVLPKVFPAIVIVLHIRKQFISTFSQRLNELCHLTVKEVNQGDLVLPGNIYLAHGDYHMTIRNTIQGYVIDLKDDLPVNAHKPSIDVLFNSVALVAADNAIGVLLTGMGKDGASGLKAIKDAGGITIAQDEQSSVVWGMPGRAIDLDAADYVVSLDDIPQKILNCLDEKIARLAEKGKE